MNESFFRAIAEMERDSPLDAPSLGDGITRPPADTNMTREAYEASKGEPVAFWEHLYDLHGGQPDENGLGDKAQYVQEGMSRLSDLYHEINGLYRQYEPDGTDSLVSVRGMTPDALIDARTIEHLPATWFDYHSFDQRDMAKVGERIAAQTAFGRGGERLGAAFDTVSNEVKTAQTRMNSAIAEAKRANPQIKGRDLEAKLVQKFGKDEYRKLKQQVDRAPLLAKSVKELSDYFRKDGSPDGTVKTITRAAQSLAMLLVSQPSSAINHMAALLDLNYKYGASGATTAGTLKAAGAFGREVAGSLAQAMGLEMFNTSEYHRMFRDLGLSDPGASQTFKDAFNRLEGESASAHFFRGINEVTRRRHGERGVKASTRRSDPSSRSR